MTTALIIVLGILVSQRDAYALDDGAPNCATSGNCGRPEPVPTPASSRAGALPLLLAAGMALRGAFAKEGRRRAEATGRGEGT